MLRTKHRSARQHIMFAVVGIAVGALIGTGTYAVSVEPGAAAVKAVFEVKPEVTPPTDFAAIVARTRQKPTVTITTRNRPDATLQILTPAGAAKAARPMILWIHGGGFISSSAETVKDYAIMLAAKGYVVGNLDYAIAPAAKYPTPVIQANAAIRYLATHASDYAGDKARIFVGGDSAGAQIASETAAAMTNPELAAALRITPGTSAGHIAGVVLLCGLYDMNTVGSTGFPALRTYLWAYTGTRDWQHYDRIDELSTTRTATSAYPPTFITVGNADPFQSQGRELASTLKDKGIDVTTVFWNQAARQLGHEYQFDFTTPEARTTFAATTRFLAANGTSR